MRRRVDAELVRRGMVPSRAEAVRAVEAGRVIAAGRTVRKPSTLVAASESLQVEKGGGAFASRGGEKLAAALDRFEISPAGRSCLDAGASSGGFTDCLLSRGAARVVAVDVGYGQLDWRLRGDPRVIVLERTNARDLDPGRLPFRPELIVADLSFISLRLILPALARIASANPEYVLLVKPQFEVGQQRVGKGGVVKDADAWRDAVSGVVAAARDVDLAPLGVMASPLRGPAGNVEFLLHLGRSRFPHMTEGGNRSDLGDRFEAHLDAALRDALAVRDQR